MCNFLGLNPWEVHITLIQSLGKSCGISPECRKWKLSTRTVLWRPTNIFMCISPNPSTIVLLHPNPTQLVHWVYLAQERGDPCTQSARITQKFTELTITCWTFWFVSSPLPYRKPPCASCILRSCRDCTLCVWYQPAENYAKFIISSGPTCSTDLFIMYRTTVTALVWPSLRMRAIAWLSTAGFHCGSTIWTRLATERLLSLILKTVRPPLSPRFLTRLLIPYSPSSKGY